MEGSSEPVLDASSKRLLNSWLWLLLLFSKHIMPIPASVVTLPSLMFPRDSIGSTWIIQETLLLISLLLSHRQSPFCHISSGSKLQLPALADSPRPR
nr:COMM domain-containing protein 6 isoform X2 [Oryctolagus cuniculus]